MVNVPIAAVSKATYWAGEKYGTPSPATIEICFAGPHRTMRFPRLAPAEKDLCRWTCALLDKSVN